MRPPEKLKEENCLEKINIGCLPFLYLMLFNPPPQYFTVYLFLNTEKIINQVLSDFLGCREQSLVTEVFSIMFLLCLKYSFLRE